MNKISFKRIIGLFIFALIITVINTKSVFAATCQDVVNKLNDNDMQLKRYGLSMTYDRESKKYVVKSDVSNDTIETFHKFDKNFRKNKIKFKVDGLYFYEPSENAADEKKILKNEVEGKHSSSVINASGRINDYKNRGIIDSLSITAKGEFTIKRDILGDSDDSHSGVAVKLVPDGFNDPELVAACNSNATFYMMVYTSVETGEEKPPEEIIIETSSDSSFSYGQIDCTNYASKYKETEFNYNFCKDKLAAEKSSTTRNFTIKNYKKDTAGIKSSMIKYEEINGTLKEIKDPLAFKCNYKDTISGISKNDEEYYVNKNYIHGKGTITITEGQYVYTGEYSNTTKKAASCELECEEIVKVEYGPPVASKAGLCFEYKVKVTSRVNCAMKKEPTPPPKQYICTPTPWCNHPGGYPDHQGGPDDEFDECVSKCDGGIYSDRCTNKCYKQVYGESLVRETAGTLIEYGDGKTVDRSKLLYQFKYQGGEVVWDVGGKRVRRYEIASDGSKSYPAGPGGPKQHSHASRDVITDSYWHKHNSWGYPTSYYYYYDKTGIPKIEHCSSTDCWWELNKSDACKDKSNYRYLNHPSVYTDRYGTKYPGVSAQEQDKKENQKLYEELKKKCSAYASCNTTTAEFTISVDYTEKGNKTKQTIEFPYSNDKKNTITSKNNNASCLPGEDQGSILLSYDGCYKCGKVSENRMYMTEWSFPGTWIHNKNGNIAYVPTSVNNTSWRYIKNKFCLPLNIANVNEKWYNYYQAKVNGNDPTYSYNNTEYMNNITCPDGSKITNPCNYKETTITESDKIDYNINATARSFGMYEWDINISCFYAINDVFPKVKETDKCESKCTSSNSGKDDNKVIRQVDLNNLFPDKSGNQLASSDTTGRTPGFNWTSFADQTKKDTDYTSLPSNYAKWIQAKGTSVYSDRYLDYEINLTKEIITELKKEVNTGLGKNYTNWQGDVEINSVTNYQSPLFRNGGILSKNSKYPVGDAITCNNMKNYASTECEDFSGEVR